MSFRKIVKNKQHHMKVLLNSFHLNGHTLGFHPQTQKVCTTKFIDSRFASRNERVKTYRLHGHIALINKLAQFHQDVRLGIF